jgi:hypothetical protein
MTERSPRATGAVFGSCAGLSAGYGASWSGLGDTGVHIWILAVLVSAIMGAFSWPPLQNPGDRGTPHIVFAGLFGGTAGLLAGAFVAYPFGALFGGAGGFVGAAVACFLLRFERLDRHGVTAALVASVGSVAGLLFVVGTSP